MGNRIDAECNGKFYKIDEKEHKQYSKKYDYIFSQLVERMKNFDEKVKVILFDKDDTLKAEGELTGYTIIAYTKRGTAFCGESFNKDHSNDERVLNSFIEKWNQLPDIESEKEQVEVEFNGMKITFNREWGGYRFSDDEIKRLSEGEYIAITPKNDSGEEYEKIGHFGQGKFNGFKYWGFIPDNIPKKFAGHILTAEERIALLKGKKVFCDDLVSNRTGKTYSANLIYEKKKNEEEKRIRIEFVN